MKPTYLQKLKKQLVITDRTEFEKKLIEQEIVIMEKAIHYVKFYHIKNYSDYCSVIDGIFESTFIRNIYKSKYKFI